MNYVSKLLIIQFLSFPLSIYAGDYKSNNLIISLGINHTSLQYVNSAAYFTDDFHIKPCSNISFQHQFNKNIGLSIGFDYSILGGKKNFSYTDSAYQFDSLALTYNFVSTNLIEGSYTFNFTYLSLPLLLSCKIFNLPLEAAFGPSFGYVDRQERVDQISGPGVSGATPANKKKQFHSRINAILKYTIPLKNIGCSAGFLYSHDLTEIKSVLTSRGIKNVNELRLFFSVLLPQFR
jgi:hypothetical protein